MIRQDLAATAQVLADQLNRTLAARYHEVGNLAKLEPLRPVWQGEPAAMRGVLENLQSSYLEYSWIGFADRLAHIPSGSFTNLLDYMESFAKMDRLDAEVIPSHDPAVLRTGEFG